MKAADLGAGAECRAVGRAAPAPFPGVGPSGYCESAGTTVQTGPPYSAPCTWSPLPWQEWTPVYVGTRTDGSALGARLRRGRFLGLGRTNDPGRCAAVKGHSG